MNLPTEIMEGGGVLVLDKVVSSQSAILAVCQGWGFRAVLCYTQIKIVVL